jgi:cyclopropane fatty-acyl-phospholipid synthase-like methyltransferase
MVTLDQNNLKTWQENNLECKRYEYDLKPTDHVLDIGSYRREFADEIIKRYGCSVECFDALDNKAAWLFDGQLSFGGQCIS